jgi:hypothetical protein
VGNSKNITNSQNGVRKKSFGGTFCFSNCHIIGLDTGGLVFLVSGLVWGHCDRVMIIIKSNNLDNFEGIH